MMIYEGIIEASGAVALDGDHFVVASDETNVMKIYRHGTASPVGTLDLSPFLGDEGCDIEAGGRIGNRIYWITSHSKPQGGGNARGRSVFFATVLDTQGDVPVLMPEATPFRSMRGDIKAAIGGDGSGIDIEGLAATSDGRLLIAFRGPLDAGRAMLLPLLNPQQLVECTRAEPAFGSLVTLDLDGRGIRSIEATGVTSPAYLILAGPTNDSKGHFTLYEWNGGDANPQGRTDVPLEGLTPEAIVVNPDPARRSALILSDDGTRKRNDADTPEHDRRFRSIEISF